MQVIDTDVGDEIRVLSTGTEWLKVVLKLGGGLLLAKSDGLASRFISETAVTERRATDAPTFANARQSSGTARINDIPVHAYRESESPASHAVTVAVICNPGSGHFVRRFTIPASDFEAG